jgi:hypothetical protein
MFGTCVAETILASVHVRTQQQAGHMDASDQIKLSQNILQVGGRPHMGFEPTPVAPKTASLGKDEGSGVAFALPPTPGDCLPQGYRGKFP